MARSLGLVVLLVAVLAACGSATSSTEDDATAPPAPTAQASPADVVDLQAVLVRGTWEDAEGTVLDFNDDGTYVVGRGYYERGVWSTDGDVLTLTTDDGSRFCEQTSGSYRLTFDDARRVADLDTVDDPCDARRENLGGGGILQQRDG